MIDPNETEAAALDDRDTEQPEFEVDEQLSCSNTDYGAINYAL